MQSIVLHRQQVHTKLVSIMRERLAATLHAIPAISQQWAACQAPWRLADAASPARAANGSVARADSSSQCALPAELAGGASSAWLHSSTSAPGSPASAGANGHLAAQKGRRARRKAVAEPLEQLMRQVATLAAVLTPILARAQLVDIFLRLRRMYADSLARCAV